MSTQNVIQLNKAMIDAWNSHDVNRVLELCDKNVTWEDVGIPEPFKGLDGVRKFYNMWHTAFPDFRLNLRNTIGNETSVAGELEFSGTNTGSLEMPGQQPIPTTNRKVTANKGAYFATFANGKVVSVSTHPDLMGMMAQLGLLQEQHA